MEAQGKSEQGEQKRARVRSGLWSESYPDAGPLTSMVGEWISGGPGRQQAWGLRVRRLLRGGGAPAGR